MKKIPIEVSARHVHLSQKDLGALFGREYRLKKLRELPTTNQFAARETLDIKVGSKEIKGVRIVGPLREKTQIELSVTDTIYLGIKTPIRISGDLKGTSGAVLTGPRGKIRIRDGVIVAWRHIHCSPEEAPKLGFKRGKEVSVEVKGKRAVTFHNVRIRVREDYKLCMHFDTDEGNAAGIIKRGTGKIIIKK